MQSITPTSQCADPALNAVLDTARRAFMRGIPILISGETGTGKEVVAQQLHHSGHRCNGAFIAINCSSIPTGLIESELFGYEDGAFTGGRRGGAAGKFEQAHGGTLFLDEIGDMPVELQARLLRVLQERSLTRIGGSRLIRVDPSIVCATHRDLRALVAAKTFREDLYYRLHGLRVTLPPLRERNDIRELIYDQLAQATAGRSPLTLSDAVMDLLLRYRWPGNIRQLGHVIQLAAVLAERTGRVEPQHLPEELCEAVPQDAAGALAVTPMEQAECELIQQALRKHRGNKSAAARYLGIGRATMHRKLRAFGRSD